MLRRLKWTRRWRELGAVGLFAAFGLLCYFQLFWEPGSSYRGLLPAVTKEQQSLAARLRADVMHLGAVIGERNVDRPNALDQARKWLEGEVATLAPTLQSFEVGGVTCSNVEVVLTGTTPGEDIVVGAHYDTARGTPGANDNGSGVAVLLELTRSLPRKPMLRTVRLVFFTNEEPPHFQGPDMGSVRYTDALVSKGTRVAGMLSLETLGYYSDEEGSQSYPGPVGWLRPSRGNFLAFVGNPSSRSLAHRALSVFREASAFPSEVALLPSATGGAGWSDHWSFWQHDIPAIMVTDTALFRYPHYHEPSDTPSQLDYERLARATEGIEIVVRDLANHGVP